MAPVLVQSKSATGTASPLSVTLSSPTTAGSTIVVCVSSDGTTNPAVTAITLGGSAGNFAVVLTAGNPASDAVTASIWADPNCAGGQTALSITLSNGAAGSTCVTVMEWSGLDTTAPNSDKTASQLNDTPVSSWSSTATAATSQASEVAIGMVGAFNSSGVGTIGGPSSPWTNLTQQTSASTHVALLAGYQVLSSTAAVTYSGTFPGATAYTALVATFKAAAAASGDNSPYVLSQNTGFF